MYTADMFSNFFIMLVINLGDNIQILRKIYNNII